MPARTPTVSVIIPTYNYAHYLSEAIESVLGQSEPPCEVLVVDDGSTDRTESVGARYSRHIRLLRQPNEGVSAARNRGAALAEGDCLAFLDADDLWLPRKLERQRQRFLDDPALGLIHCGFESIDATGEAVDLPCLEGLEGVVADEMLLFRRPVILGGGSGVLIPRTVFQAVGGFDPRLSTSADWDLYYRIARLHRVGFVPEVLLRYRRHGANMHGNVRAMEHDMLLAYEKAFAADPALARLRRRCYGNLHTVLAGSFFTAGCPRDFLRHGLRGLLLNPTNVVRYLGYPVRKWCRQRKVARPS